MALTRLSARRVTIYPVPPGADWARLGHRGRVALDYSGPGELDGKLECGRHADSHDRVGVRERTI